MVKFGGFKDVAEELSTSVFKACPKDGRSSLHSFGTVLTWKTT
jgi:hypothetical protein